MLHPWTIYLPCLLIINGFTILINLLVVIMFIRFKKELLKVNSNKFLFSLAIADSLVGLFGVIGSYIHYLYHKDLIDEDIVGLCGLLPIFVSFFMSISSLIIITFDRLIVVVYALRYHSIMTDFRANLLICITWLMVPVILITQGAIYLGLSISLELKVRTYQLTTFFIIGTTVLSFGNIKLHFVIRRKKEKTLVNETPNTESPIDTNPRSRGIKPTKDMGMIVSNSRLCLWMIAVYVMCWLPVTVDYVVYSVGYQDPDDLRFTICICIAASNSLINPVLYLVMRKDFRKRFGEMFTHCKRNWKKMTKLQARTSNLGKINLDPNDLRFPICIAQKGKTGINDKVTGEFSRSSQVKICE